MNTSLYRTSLALIHQQYKPLVSFIPLNTLQLWFLIMGIMLLHYNVVVLVLIMFACRLTMCSSSNAKDSRLCIERERQALLAFKQSLSDPYNTLSSWSGQDCCRWDGVFCNNITGRIMKLDLSNKGLIGSEVSSSLSELNHLEDLDLTRNNFSASKIPSFFGNFKSLRSLNLSDASFAGVVPPSLGNISTLQELNLRHLELLKVHNLNWLSHLSNLRTLDLSSVDLSQVYDLPQVLNSFPSLSDLYLEGCNLVKFPLSSLSNANLTNVRTLNLSVNHFTGDLPDLLTQLPSIQRLDLSSNSFSGLTPSFFTTKSSTLRYLVLDSNQLNGTIPESIGQLSNLQILSLANNSLSGFVSEIHFEKLSSLKVLDMSSNSLAMNVSTDWVPPFQLRDLYLVESCKFGNRFPRWLLTQKSIEFIAIPNSSISGSIPQNIGNMMPNLVLMILSHNNISGSIPISLCGMRNLTLLDIGHNHLSGDLPENCWSESRFMMILDLSFNSLTGLIPRSVGNLSSLISLHLNNNEFYGELPVEMENCKSLSILDLGKNGFSGNLPAWIKGLKYLRILNLRSNNFGGSLVQDLCVVSELQILDLAHNNISGTIPSCFGNFNGMTQGGNMGIFRRFFTDAGRLNEVMNGRELDGIFRRFFIYSGGVSQVIKGRDLLYIHVLGYLVNLDLSSNNLAGHIPEELTYLSGLVGLNLSHNKLIGLIPEKIGNIIFLESLDFSFNHLTGMIPQSISMLNDLTYLNFSYNNLFGRIPTGYQLQTFVDPSIYEGNQGLCGVQIEKECAKDEPFQFNDDDGEANEETKKIWLYIGLFIGFVVGFWGVCGVLFFKTTWRHTYFRFIESVYEMLIVKILIYASLVEKKF